MKPKELRWFFLAALVALIIIGCFGEPVELGVFSAWINGRYRFGGGTAPWALVFGLVTMGLYLLLMYSTSVGESQPLPGILRRFVAFWLDFMLAIFTVLPIVGILPMLTEWRRTRVFQWSFERTIQAPGDGAVGALGTALAFAALIGYYALPLVRGKPSPGSCVLGYQIIPEEGKTIRLPTAVGRTLLGFLAACGAWLAPFVARDREKGQFWLDKVFRTRAVKLG